MVHKDKNGVVFKDKRNLFAFDPKSIPENRMRGMEYWVNHCKDKGLVCGDWPTGNCEECVSGLVPPPFNEIASEEMNDQPDEYKIPGVDIRSFRWWSSPQPSRGIHHRGWWRVYNGTYVPSIWNLVRSTCWRDDLELLRTDGLRLIGYDPERDMDPDSESVRDRGPGLYLKPNDSPDYTFVNDARSIDEISDTRVTSEIGRKLSERAYVCHYCQERGRMERRDDKRLYCTSCGTRRVLMKKMKAKTKDKMVKA